MNNMRITNEYIASLKPCENRHNNYLAAYRDTDFSIVEFLTLESISYSDKIWVWKKFATINEAAMFGLSCADSVLHIFEEKHPNDNRPRLALEAVREYLKDPTLENKQKCKDAYASAYASAYAAYTAAYAAAAAASAAADDDAAASAAAAAYAAASAAASAAADDDAAWKDQQNLNITFLIAIYEGM